ncbi:THO complex subunit 7 homolog [Ischnura elegans]|uniref:THO complex subunit 7 homolog n=1 Tax=Ischnura elegans TaxID=197161 RepID=UPI001ED88800|nr:THO complex subunit 7 homolog [Ischnura elegans]
MTDEEVIRRRLLIDGDGCGDDRRLNVLLKTFIKWCNTTEIPSESQVTLDRMLAQLCQFECALARSRLVARAAQAEVNNYKLLSASVERGLSDAREGITATLEEFARAKVVRRQRVRYDALASVISAQPDRRETAKRLAGLKGELRALEETREMLDRKLDVRRKQFHVLVATIHQLQSMLDEGTSGGGSSQGNGRSSSATPKLGEGDGLDSLSDKRGTKRRSGRRGGSKKQRRDESGKRSHRSEGASGGGSTSSGRRGGGAGEEGTTPEEEEEEEEDEEEEEEPEDVSAMMDISLDAFEDEDDEASGALVDSTKGGSQGAPQMEVDGKKEEESVKA